MNTDFEINESELSNLILDYYSFECFMKDILKEVNDINKELLEGQWEGESKKAFMAYFDLVLQYHKKICSAYGEIETPIEQMNAVLDHMLDDSVSFYDNSDIYKKFEFLL